MLDNNFAEESKFIFYCQYIQNGPFSEIGGCNFSGLWGTSSFSQKKNLFWVSKKKFEHEESLLASMCMRAVLIRLMKKIILLDMFY